ncbi:MAG: hypothetical protein OEY01_00020 [Desulfobulbaceae bacterium]|nr:hypothetical protein [Desulfobulbaceae bacterium]HIJ77679.1 hypothetical protein [Deltaproteobacteria bacterium]
MKWLPMKHWMVWGLALGLVAFSAMGPVEEVYGKKEPWQWLASLRGSGLKTPLLLPTAVYVDESKERYYVIDAGGDRIFSYDKEGTLLKIFAGEGEHLLQKPYDMVRLADGQLVVVEKERNTLAKIDLKNKKTEYVNIVFDKKRVFVDRLDIVGDHIYVLDRTSGSVFCLNEQLAVTRHFPAPAVSNGIVDFQVRDGKLWVLGQLDKRLYQLGDGGKVEAQLELGNSLAFPVSFDMDASGNFYVLDRHLGSVVVYDGTGHVKYSFLGKGHNRDMLFYPNEIRFDPWGRMCVVDEGNGRVEIFTR